MRLIPPILAALTCAACAVPAAVPLPGKLAKLFEPPPLPASPASEERQEPGATLRSGEQGVYYTYGLEREHMMTMDYLKKFRLKLSRPASREEAVVCESLFALGNAAKTEHPADARLAILAQGSFQHTLGLYDLAVSSSPGLASQGFGPTRDAVFKDIKNHFGRTQGRYLADLDAFVRDYKVCQSKGLIPPARKR